MGSLPSRTSTIGFEEAANYTSPANVAGLVSTMKYAIMWLASALLYGSLVAGPLSCPAREGLCSWDAEAGWGPYIVARGPRCHLFRLGGFVEHDYNELVRAKASSWNAKAAESIIDSYFKYVESALLLRNRSDLTRIEKLARRDGRFGDIEEVSPDYS
jgi:hypothetical protein